MKSGSRFESGISLLFLSFSDALCTAVGINLGIAEEANPAMKLLIDSSMVLFFLLKIGLPVLLIMLLCRFSATRLFSSLLFVAIALYLLVNVYHVYWMTNAFVAVR